MRAVLNSALIILGIAATFYLGLCLLLYLQQDDVLFYPRPNDSALLTLRQAGKIEIPGAPVPLDGWWTENSASATPFVIVYFGGNAEDVLYTAGLAPRFEARQMLVVNYRGYGQTAGSPSQAALFEDALRIYDYLVQQAGVKPEQVILMGRSLGSGVATMLAANRPTRAAVLITPFDSIAAVAAAHYPIFPVKLLLRHPFDSVSYASKANIPALILAAQNDRVIPPSHARALAQSWPAQHTFEVLQGVGHNDVEQHPEYFARINQFLLAL